MIQVNTLPWRSSDRAIRACIDEALRCKQSGESKTLLFNFSGHGHFDMSAYDRYFAGDLQDQEFDQAGVDAALARLPDINVA